VAMLALEDRGLAETLVQFRASQAERVRSSVLSPES
jgi:phosphoribosylcarboxyaminoimidazole (NCAIR) mutase